MAMSAAAVAAIALGSQKFGKGPIHNDTSPSVPVAASRKVYPWTTAKVRVDGADDGELRLLVWGSNRSVCLFTSTPPPFVHALRSHKAIAHGFTLYLIALHNL